MLVSTKDKPDILSRFPAKPERIVSLVPSQTELLFSLGLGEEVVGITKFCIHPESWFRKKQRVGGTKTVDREVVKALHPDLIIANKEENVREQIEELQQIAPVFVSDINTLTDALEMILFVGKLVRKEARGRQLVDEIEDAFRQITPLKEKLNTAYLIWKDPYMAAGGDTFIHDMLCQCGFSNIFQNVNRYPEVFIRKSSNDSQSTSNLPSTVTNPLPSVNSHRSTGLTSSVTSHPSTDSSSSETLENCQLLLLSSEPFPFKQKHIDELRSSLPLTKILLVDGQMFSWYGSRLLHSPKYFRSFIKQIQG